MREKLFGGCVGPVRVYGPVSGRFVGKKISCMKIRETFYAMTRWAAPSDFSGYFTLHGLYPSGPDMKLLESGGVETNRCVGRESGSDRLKSAKTG